MKIFYQQDGRDFYIWDQTDLHNVRVVSYMCAVPVFDMKAATDALKWFQDICDFLGVEYEEKPEDY